MTITLINPASAESQGRSLHPTAFALTTSVAAVRDALDHMNEGAVLSVPIGEPHQNFDVVEWCARNGKAVINRFDPWPLAELLVRNDLQTTPMVA